jgi:hypothetical protein
MAGFFFPWVCQANSLEDVQAWFAKIGAVISTKTIEDGFQVACAYGRLEVAQWLGAVSGVNVHAKDDVAFRKTCRYGHLHVAKWVFGLGGVDIHADGDYAFRHACVDKHADTARWLISLDPDWAWPIKRMQDLQVWSAPRDAWMRATRRS